MDPSTPTATRTRNAFAVPDRQVMADFMASHTSAAAEAATARAQEVAYDAWNAETRAARLALARKALKISPLCADAFVILAHAAKTKDVERDHLALGVHAGALALGPDWFENHVGEFWGFFETRPYMRALAGLAITLAALGDDAGAADHFRTMLRLNPNDNQGIRYPYLGCLLRQGDIGAVQVLLAAYPDEWSPAWHYSKLLLAFRAGNGGTAKTAKLVHDAMSANAHVPAILASKMPCVVSRGFGVLAGGPEEATQYVFECGKVWRHTPGATAWLLEVTSAHAAGLEKAEKRR